MNALQAAVIIIFLGILVVLAGWMLWSIWTNEKPRSSVWTLQRLGAVGVYVYLHNDQADRGNVIYSFYYGNQQMSYLMRREIVNRFGEGKNTYENVMCTKVARYFGLEECV